MTSQKNAPSWSDVQVKLANFDRTDRIGLIQDLYAINKDNQAFLHAQYSVQRVSAK
jgi:hypothetical protein